MKTIKIKNETHKKLLVLKAIAEEKTFNNIIEKLIATYQEFCPNWLGKVKQGEDQK